MNRAYEQYLRNKFPRLLPTTSTPPTPLTERGIEAPDGWFYLIERALVAIEPMDVRVTQCKEKFAALRLYLVGPDYSAAASAVEPFLQESLTICEFCGIAGKTMTVHNSVMVTACPQHALYIETKRKFQWDAVLVPHVWVGDTCRGCGCQGGLYTEQGLYFPQRNGRPVSLDCRIVKHQT